MKFSESYISLNWLSGALVGVGASDLIGSLAFYKEPVAHGNWVSWSFIKQPGAHGNFREPILLNKNILLLVAVVVVVVVVVVVTIVLFFCLLI